MYIDFEYEYARGEPVIDISSELCSHYSPYKSQINKLLDCGQFIKFFHIFELIRFGCCWTKLIILEFFLKCIKIHIKCCNNIFSMIKLKYFILFTQVETKKEPISIKLLKLAITSSA